MSCEKRTANAVKLQQNPICVFAADPCESSLKVSADHSCGSLSVGEWVISSTSKWYSHSDRQMRSYMFIILFQPTKLMLFYRLCYVYCQDRQSQTILFYHHPVWNAKPASVWLGGLAGRGTVVQSNFSYQHIWLWYSINLIECQPKRHFFNFIFTSAKRKICCTSISSFDFVHRAAGASIQSNSQ